MLMASVTISLKSDNKSYSQKFVANGEDMPDITMDHDNIKLQAMVREAEKNFGDKPTKITVKSTMNW